MKNHDETATAQGAFRVSKQPVTKKLDGATAQKDAAAADQLPRSYGAPLLFAVARDPKSIFVYWDIDWSEEFRRAPARERHIFLRLFDAEENEVQRTRVEPLAGNANLQVPTGGDSLRVEIGYFDDTEEWRSLGEPANVSLPPDHMGNISPGDFALVPFHITFQRLTEVFRDSRAPRESLTASLVRLQEKAADPAQAGQLTAAESEIYRAMKTSAVQKEYRPAAFSPTEEKRLRRKLEAIIGFSANSGDSLGSSSRG